MNRRTVFVSVLIVAIALIATFGLTSGSENHVTSAVTGTSFTYQGYLEVNSLPANGDYDFRFRL